VDVYVNFINFANPIGGFLIRVISLSISLFPEHPRKGATQSPRPTTRKRTSPSRVREMHVRGNGAAPPQQPQTYVRVVAPHAGVVFRSIHPHLQGATTTFAGSGGPANPPQSVSPGPRFNALLRPKACLACRLAHASCDRYSPATPCASILIHK
jgi:hypothetical protein